MSLMKAILLTTSKVYGILEGLFKSAPAKILLRLRECLTHRDTNIRFLLKNVKALSWLDLDQRLDPSYKIGYKKMELPGIWHSVDDDVNFSCCGGLNFVPMQMKFHLLMCQSQEKISPDDLFCLCKSFWML